MADQINEIVKVNISKNHESTDFSDIYVNRRNIIDSYDEEVTATIGIVAYNRLDITKLCVESVLKYTNDVNYKLILVYNENELGNGILDYFKSVNYKNKVIIHLTENLGAPIAYQQISKYIEGKYFVHLPNDVIVTHKWLSNLIKCAESDETIGMVNPVSSNVSNRQQVNLNFNNYDEMQAAASEYNISDPSKWQQRLRLITLGTLFTRECLSTVGDVFDLGFVHDFGDDDVSFRVRRAGYKIILACDTWVHHAHECVARSAEILENGRNIFKQKYYGIDAWDDVNNFVGHIINENISMPDDVENVNILGIDVKCGTPILDIKNAIREYGINNPELSAFSKDSKYYMDLKTICNGNVVCDRTDYLYSSFKNNYFDYIIIGQNINEYFQPEKVIRDVYALLKQNGQLFISLKNTYNVFTLLKSLGHDINYSQPAKHYEISEFCTILKNMGISTQLIYLERFNTNNVVFDFTSKIIDFAKPDYSNRDDVINKIMTDRFWIKIVKK